MEDLFNKNDVKIAVIGGGTGSFTLLSSLKNHTPEIAALVNMADDGSSTGVLRDELGVLPPGDIRQCLVALAREPRVRDLFSYRFDEGSLKGHAFGNLFLAALERMTGDFAAGVELASDVLNIVGTVEPITLTNVRLAMQSSDGKVIRGEFLINETDLKNERPNMWLEPDAEANPKAIAAILQADMVVIAPGNLYGSIAPALIVPGIGEALRETEAFCVYVSNLVTKPGQTDNYSVSDFVEEIERLAGGTFLDAVLFNTEHPTDELLSKYAKKGELRVEFDREKLHNAPYIAAGAELLSGKPWTNMNKSDPIGTHRTLIRHDSDATASALMSLYETYGDIT
jgi:uncharacterized cofD-like protein